ncbi:MAG: DUF2516 family protein [Micrococcales bacterium]|nr:DUF2516 family protein [Micrococcales bacterium]
MVVYIQLLLFMAFYGAIFIASVWALVDLLRRPTRAFVDAGKRTKTFWLAILVTATVVSFIAVPFTGGSVGGPVFSFLALGAAVAAVVYLADVRPAVARHTRRGPRGPSRW